MYCRIVLMAVVQGKLRVRGRGGGLGNIVRGIPMSMVHLGKLERFMERGRGGHGVLNIQWRGATEVFGGGVILKFFISFQFISFNSWSYYHMI